MNAKIISLFNHKGGVSKTTTTYNLAWKLTEKGKKVLIVDADSQCNLTGLILGDDFEDYYTNENTKYNNIMDAVKPAFDGKPQPIKAIDCYSPRNNHYLYLLPGHMNLSEYDPTLSLALSSSNAISTLQNLPGSFYEVIKLCCERYSIDYVFIDLNPGLSALNQVFFIYCDAFIVPTNPDPFSVMALNTLKKILPRWKNWSKNNYHYFEDASYPLPDKEMLFLGEIIQRFNLRKGSAAKSFVDRIEEIKNTVKLVLVPEFTRNNMIFDIERVKKYGISDEFCLVEISDFGSLLQASHEAQVPVFALSDEQIKYKGTVLDQMKSNRDNFNQNFELLASIVMEIENA